MFPWSAYQQIHSAYLQGGGLYFRMEELDLLNELSPKSDGNTTYNDDYNTLSVNKAFSSSRSSLNAGSEYSDDFNSFINDSEGFTSFISSGYGTRPSSTGPTSDPNEIINSLHLDMPELTPILSSNSPQKRSSRASSAVAPPKMTDLGFKMSKMIMSTTRKQDDANEEEYDDDESQINSGDSLVDNYGQAKKRQRTGKRGRPKGSTKVGTQFGRASSTHAMPPNVSALMGQANVAYVQKHYSKAIELYLQVVQRAPASPEPYYSLGLVYDEQDNADKAASYFLIAAHMQPRAEGELWRRIAALLVRVVPPRKDQAVYCLTRAIKASKPANYRIHDDLPIYWLRAKLQLEIGEYRSAITGFASALRLHLALESEDMSPFVLVARLAVRMSLSYVAVGVFENVFRSAVSAALPLSWSHLNILVELAEVDKDYSSIVSSIEEFSVSCYLQSGREQGRTDWMLKTAAEQLKKALESDDMPVELKLKYAIAQIHINSSGVSNAENLLILLGQIEDGCSVSLKESVSEALIILNAPIPALKLLLELIEEDAKLATPEMCLKIGQCYRKAGELEMAVESFLAGNLYY
jgi:tetratricopeptide (TPR) repeat protein